MRGQARCRIKLARCLSSREVAQPIKNKHVVTARISADRVFIARGSGLTTQDSNPAHGTQRLQPRRSRRVRCSAWLGRSISNRVLLGVSEKCVCRELQIVVMNPEMIRLRLVRLVLDLVLDWR